MRGSRLCAVLVSLAIAPAAWSQDYGLQDGAYVYGEHCLGCHQADGRGVPFLQPSLERAPRVLGEDTALIRFMLEGSQNLPPEERTSDNVMSGYAHFDDVAIAAVINFIRTSFGNDGPEVTPDQVAEVRKSTDDSTE